MLRSPQIPMLLHGYRCSVKLDVEVRRELQIASQRPRILAWL
jgi:hypothetical protein